MYQPEDFDLAGFAVGVVEKHSIIDQSKVAAGDVLIGIDSSGPHSNGYSLIRTVLERSGASLDESFGDSTLGATLLEPTMIYVKALAETQAKVEVTALAHITGGGLLENLPRVLPSEAKASINLASWKRPAIFNWLQEHGQIEDMEMLRTFNCGIGMIAAVRSADVQLALDTLNHDAAIARVIGKISKREPDEETLVFV
jgi:phosphoribosylformylglycinamidine cyclo-ligase